MVIRAVLVASLLWPMVGAAQSDPKKLVHEAVEHYEAGRYTEAVQVFEAAYRLTRRPAILFNIARAESKRGNEEAAIAFLKRYLEELPGADDASSVRAEVEARERALAETRAKTRAQAEANAARVAAQELEARSREAARAEASVSRARAERMGRVRKVGFALLGAGVVLAGVGIGLGVAAEQAARAVEGQQGRFDDCCADLDRQGHLTMGFGIALDVLGGAGAASGVGLLGWSARK